MRQRPHTIERPPGTAVEFLRQSIRDRPGEVVLLTIGPLTNVALLFALDPDIPSLLRRIVSMAGVYFPPAADVEEGEAETNVRLDPVAAAIFQPNLCRYADGRVTVDVAPDGPRTGRTTFTRAGEGVPALHRIATAVDAAAFVEEFFARFE